MTTTYVTRAPPVKGRPRCLRCGKRLKPHYDVKYLKVEVGISEEMAADIDRYKTLKTGEERLQYRPHTIEHEGETYSLWHYSRGEDGEPYYTIETGNTEKRWTGHYGVNQGDFFCSRDCGYYWAAAIHKRLKGTEGGSYVCYDQNAPPD